MDKAHKKTDLIIEEVEAAYDKFYRKKQAEIKRTVDAYFAKFERQDKKWRADVEKGVKTEAQYKAWRKSHLARGKAYKDMQAKVANELYNVNQTATQYVNDRLAEVYSINYNAVEGAANSLKGYSFQLVNEDVVRLLADNDSSFLPFRELDKDVDVAWNMRNINNQVMQGIKGGDSIPDIAKRILGVEAMNKNASIRTARTIVTSAENKARQDSYEQMEKDGVIMKKRWIATRDARTRDWHAELDGVMVGVNEDFHNGIGRIAYPGDPTAHPSNTYNCRCALATKITGFKKVSNKTTQNPLTTSENNGIINLLTQEQMQDNFGRMIDNISSGDKTYNSTLKGRFKNGNSTSKQLFNKYVKQNSIAETNVIGEGYFSPNDRKIHLNILADINDTRRGIGSQFFHEYGHYIDFHAGKLSTSNGDFLSALKKDLNSYLKKIQTSENVSALRAEGILMRELGMSKKHGVSDIIDGLTDGKIIGCASHSIKNPKYWQNVGAVEKEAFAHMFEASFDKEKSKYMSQYFPSASKIFKQMMKGAL